MSNATCPKCNGPADNPIGFMVICPVCDGQTKRVVLTIPTTNERNPVMVETVRSTVGGVEKRVIELAQDLLAKPRIWCPKPVLLDKPATPAQVRGQEIHEAIAKDLLEEMKELQWRDNTNDDLEKPDPTEELMRRTAETWASMPTGRIDMCEGLFLPDPEYFKDQGLKNAMLVNFQEGMERGWPFGKRNFYGTRFVDDAVGEVMLLGQRGGGVFELRRTKGRITVKAQENAEDFRTSLLTAAMNLGVSFAEEQSHRIAEYMHWFQVQAGTPFGFGRNVTFHALCDVPHPVLDDGVVWCDHGSGPFMELRYFIALPRVNFREPGIVPSPTKP